MTQPSPSADAETQLISRAIAGDGKAFGVLYDRYLNIVYNYVYYQVGNTGDTELLTEKIFLKAYDQLSRFAKEKKIKNFSVWLLRLASAEIKPYLKKHSRQKHTIEDDLLDNEQSAFVQALRRLNDQDYLFIVARFFNGFSPAKTAKLTGVRESDFNLIQWKALQALEAQVKKVGSNE